MGTTMGTVYSIPPEPHDENRTLLFPAGAVTFGLEHRSVDNSSMRASYEKLGLADRFDAATTMAFEGEGPSIHVFGSDGHEYLRFDCFTDGPHYHYNHPPDADGTAHNHWIPFDAVANGDMVTWTFERLRNRLPDMLREAGGEGIAAALDEVRVGRALTDLEARTREVLGEASPTEGASS